MPNQNFLILTCDGGGIRGLIPAMLANDLDRRFGILARVNVFGGTSAGGTLALAMAQNIPLERLIQMFLNDGSEIFTPYRGPLAGSKRGGGFLSKLKSLLHRLEDRLDKDMVQLEGFDLGDLLHIKYSNSGLVKVYSSQYGDARLKDIRPVNVATLQLLNPNTGNWRPMTLDNFTAGAHPEIRSVDAALCTSAAPVYFPPHRIAENESMGYFADGGIFANNPCTLTLSNVVAAGLLEKAGKTMDQVRVLSLGTGVTQEGISPKVVRNPDSWGILNWMFPLQRGKTPAVPLLNALLNTVMDVDAYTGAQLLGDRFRRGNVNLPDDYPLDNWQDVQTLKRWTDEYIASPAWNSICQWVEQNFC